MGRYVEGVSSPVKFGGEEIHVNIESEYNDWKLNPGNPPVVNYQIAVVLTCFIFFLTYINEYSR